jgi:murein DD-endopeptidase MepM/ murein hydrolase activator NlpD
VRARGLTRGHAGCGLKRVLVLVVGVGRSQLSPSPVLWGETDTYEDAARSGIPSGPLFPTPTTNTNTRFNPHRHALAALAVLALATTASAATPPAGLSLEQPLRQGQLVVGRTEPGARVSVDQRNLRVDDVGRFVFGLGRDQTRVSLCVRLPRDAKARCAGLSVAAREYAIERVDGLPPSTVAPDPAEQARIEREAALITKAREADTPRSDFATPFAWPARGRISGVYGSQRVLNGEPKNPHMGLDIAAPTGTQIAAPLPGVVTLVHPDMLLTGKTVVIDHGHGVSSVYIHMSRIDVSEGQRLAQGAPIGAIGMTGRASGPHLHWGLNWFEVKLDPRLSLPES